MRARAWRADEVVEDLRDRIWTYLSPASEPQRMLEAAALLQMDTADVARLARLHFLLSDEAGAFLAAVPDLLRRLPTTSQLEEERSVERVRGVVQWPRTFQQRAASGLTTLIVSRPSERAYDTPETELLVFLLAEIARLGEETGWLTSAAKGSGALLRSRVTEATRLARSRMLAGVVARPPTARSIARIRGGRHRRRFQPVLDAWTTHQRLVAHMDRDALRTVIEREGLVTRTDSVLFELLCLFTLIDALQQADWEVTPLGLIDGGVQFAAARGGEHLGIWYQRSPSDLLSGSVHRRVLDAHHVGRSTLRPDLVLRHRPGADDEDRWLVVEVKMGHAAAPDDYARRSLFDLLAYRAAFAPVLDGQPSPYGLGVAWGADLEPALNEVMLTTPDHLSTAVELFVTAGRGDAARESVG